MNVLVFTTLYPNNITPNHGVFIKERITHYAKLDGCNVKVVAPIPYFPGIKINWRWKFSQVLLIEVRDGIEVHHPRYYMVPKVGMCLYGLTLFLSVLRTIGKIRQSFDFDLIDAHFVYPDGFAAVLLGYWFGKPVVVSARGSDINRYVSFPLISRLLQCTLNRASKVIAVSQSLKEGMVRLGISREKIAVISNGVDTKKFRAVSKGAARDQLCLPRDQKVILCVGHLTFNKGFHLLIKATASIVQEFPDVHLIIIGDGALRKKLEKQVSEMNLDPYVSLKGSVPHEDLFLWYSAADLFCLASEREGWPNVILESLACGTPVVATRTDGIPEIITSEELGILTARNELNIADAFRRALRKSWEPKRLIIYAREHSWESVAHSELNLFRSVNCIHSTPIHVSSKVKAGAQKK
jgi:glycosyltransferase involved in cell wall biosynthesis